MTSDHAPDCLCCTENYAIAACEIVFSFRGSTVQYYCTRPANHPGDHQSLDIGEHEHADLAEATRGLR